MLIYYVCEDDPLSAVANKLIRQAKKGCKLEELGKKYGGRSPILGNLDKYNKISVQKPIVLFIDLDDYPCATHLLAKYRIKNQQPPERFQIRIAVREVESWLLADRQGIENYFGISQKAIPPDLELLPDPKQELLNLIKNKAKGKFQREMLHKGKAITGTGYNFHLTDFINTEWNSNRARVNADSLDRAINRISQLT